MCQGVLHPVQRGGSQDWTFARVSLNQGVLWSEDAGGWIHPGLLWVKVKSAAVEEDRRFEVLSVSVSSDASFEGHDLAVKAFGDCVGDAVGTVADDVSQPIFERASNLLQG